MLIKNATLLAHGYKSTSRRPPQPEMTLVVRGKFRVVPGGVVELPEGPALIAQGALSGDVFAEDDDDHAGDLLYPSDLADFKPRADVLLRGTCHVPNEKPVPECPVRFAVGAWSKLLRVVGPRTWQEGLLGASPSAPAPFTRMPITYANAFGGPGHAPNPVGKGLVSADLPTIESPREPVHARSERPAPAGFGPLSPHWPPRAGKLGKAPSKHGGKGSPFFGDDLDWSYFNAAPADQQIDGYLRGDEELVFQNLHPTIQVLTTRLPGLRIRAFVNDVEGRFREVPMHLDTLFADLDEGFVYLTWRGLDAVGEMDLVDVKSVLLASEPMSAAPLPVEHHRATLEAFERDPKRLDEVLSGAELAEVERAQAAARAAQAGGSETGSDDPLSGLLDRKLGGLDPTVKQRLQRSLSALMTATARQGVDVKSHIAAALEKARPGAGPGKRSGGILHAVQERVAALRREAASLNSAQQAELDAYEKLLADPRVAELGPAATSAEEPGPGRDLTGQDLSGQDLRGRDLRGANLTRALLSKANLQNANLSGARLRQAVLSEADLSGADLSNADLTEALLLQARAPGANFSGANLSGAIFHEADLQGASLAAATGASPVFAKVDLTGVNARGARFHKPVATEAVLEGADLEGAELVQGVFAQCKAKGLRLAGATLTRTSFFGSDLTSAALDSAQGVGTAWVGADLTGADFGHAALPDGLFNEAKLVKSRFFGANLKRGRFYRAVVEGADLTSANLFEANFTRASITATRFVEANLYDARLVLSTGDNNDFTRANLKLCVMEIRNARG